MHRQLALSSTEQLRTAILGFQLPAAYLKQNALTRRPRASESML